MHFPIIINYKKHMQLISLPTQYTCHVLPRSTLLDNSGFKGQQRMRYGKLTHKGIIAGKSKEQIPQQTPSGSLML